MNDNLEYGKVIESFRSNINKLRDYVDDVTSNFDRRRIVKSKEIKKGLIPFELLKSANLPEGHKHKLNATEIKKLEERYGEKIEFEINKQSNRKILKWGDNKQKRDSWKAFREQMDEWRANDKIDEKTQMTFNMSFVRLITEVEWFFTQIIRCHYQTHPEYFVEGSKSSDTKFSYDDFKSFTEYKDEPLEFLIDLELTELMSKGFEEWLNYLEKQKKNPINLNLENLEEFAPELIEAHQRRHLLTHADGKVNRKYLSKYPKKHNNPAPELEESIDVSNTYLEKMISTFELCFILIGAEIWRIGANDKASNMRRGTLLNNLGFVYLENENYEWSILVSNYVESDKNIGINEKLYAKTNRWIATKNESGIESIEKELVVDGLPKLFRMAILILKDEVEEALPYIESLMNTKDNIWFKNRDKFDVKKREINKKLLKISNDISKRQKEMDEISKSSKVLNKKVDELRKERLENIEAREDMRMANPYITITEYERWPLFKDLRENDSKKYDKFKANIADLAKQYDKP